MEESDEEVSFNLQRYTTPITKASVPRGSDYSNSQSPASIQESVDSSVIGWKAVIALSYAAKRCRLVSTRDFWSRGYLFNSKPCGELCLEP